ncbi:MAG: hypothetical protein C4334_03285 [Pyrinomonas sp.]|uniref:hypothetical protein n=1 Tax=Pyrinomonas sp. TaxID=2080306 RepID=UPI0033241A65
MNEPKKLQMILHAQPSKAISLLRSWLILLLAVLPLLGGAVAAQQRDNLTPQEADRVRDAQRIDKRIEVFIKIIDRRLSLLTGQAPSDRKVKRENEEWGEVRGTRAELLSDIARTIDEAIDNLDDAATRPAQKDFLNKALTKMAEAAARYIAQLAPLREQGLDRQEREMLEKIIESAQQIIDAARARPQTTSEVIRLDPMSNAYRV